MLQIICAVVWCLLAAGPVFGFAALKPVLVDQGVYSNLCGDKKNCVEQDLKLNVMFTVAAGVTNIVALAVGYVLDNFGPRICCYIGSFFLAVGSILLGHQPSFIDPFVTGYTCLAIGGPFVFISSFQLANSVPKHSGKVLSCITGAFDTSAALFTIYRLIYQHGHQGLTLQIFFDWYLLVPLFIFACQIFIMPKDSYKSLGAVQKMEIEGLTEEGQLPEGLDASRLTADPTEQDSLLRRNSRRLTSYTAPSTAANLDRQRVASVVNRRKSVLEEYVGARLERKTLGVYGVMHGKSVREQVSSPWFLLMLVLTVLCMLRINYFVATIASQETYLVGASKAADLSSVFDVALPLGGLVAIPLTGVVLDGFPTITVLKIMSLVSIGYGILGCIPNFSANLVGILILVVYRPFYYTVVSDYCAKVFGFENFGTIYGLVMSISGLLNLLQTGIDRLTHSYFNMNPIPMNILLTAATAVAAWALLRYSSTAAKERLNSTSAIED